jgi:hypothetical protein
MELAKALGSTTFWGKLKLDGLSLLRVMIPAILPRRPTNCASTLVRAKLANW